MTDLGPDERRRYDAEAARQGRIALRSPWQRVVFILGLVAFVIFAVLVGVWAI